MNKIKNLFSILVIAFLMLICVGCETVDQTVDGLNDIMNLINQEFIDKTERYFFQDSDISFELVDKNATSKFIYRKYVKKLHGYEFDRAIIMIDKTYDKYYLAFEEDDDAQSGKDVFLSDKLFGEIYFYDSIKFNNINYTTLMFPHFYELDDEYDQYEGFNIVIHKSLLVSPIDYKAENVIIPKYIAKIGQYSFYENKNIKTLKCEDTTLLIESKAFSKCENLTDVYIGNGARFIYHKAFYDCKNLKYVILGKNIKIIWPYVFNYGNIYCENESKPSKWFDDFATGEAKVYWKGEWEYNSEGIPQPIEKK